MSFIQPDPYSKVNTNRLLCETETLNTKVNQYRQALSLGFPSARNESINMSMYTKTCNTFNPKTTAGTYFNNNNLSNTFTSLTKKPDFDINNVQYSGEKDKDTNLLITNLKQSYEKHINDLYSNFKICLSKLEEIGSTYNQGKIDAPLIKKVINDNLFYERENQIANFIEEISELKTQNQNINIDNIHKSYEMEIQKTKEESEKIVNDLKTENNKQRESLNQIQEELNYVKSDNEETKNEMDRLQKVISVLEIDLNASEEKIKEKNKKIEDFQVEYSNLQAQFFDASLKYKKIIEENNSLKGLVEHYEKERKEFLEKCSNFNKNESDSLFKSKIENYQNKINDLKQQNEKLENDLKIEKEKIQLNQKNFNNAMLEMQEKVKLLSGEWDKKLKTERKDYEKIINEIESKHKTQLDNIFHEHQIEIDNKNNEIEKYKESAELLKNFEKEYIRITEHEKKVNEIINQYQSKYEKEFENKKTTLEHDFQMKLTKIENDKKTEYDFLTENIKQNLQRSEKENYDMKNKIIQLENQININDSKTEKASKEIQKLSYNLNEKNIEIDNLRSQIKAYENQLKNAEETNKNLTNQIKNLQEKNENIFEIEKNLKNEKNTISNLKNEINTLIITNKEYENKIKSLTDANQTLFIKLDNNTIIKQKLLSNLTLLKNELSVLKKEYFSNFLQFQKQNQQNLDLFSYQFQLYEKTKEQQIQEINKKCQEKIKEQILLTEKIKQEKQDIIDNTQKSNLLSNDLSFKITELENEIKNYKNLISKQKSEIKSKNAELEKITTDSNQSYKKLKSGIGEMLLKFSKIKKKYQSQIFSLKTELNNIKQLYLGDTLYIRSLNQDDILQGKINLMESENNDNKELIQKLKIKLNGSILENENKKEEIQQMKECFEKLLNQKNQKIKDLQNIVNQSLNSYNAGVNSIKVAKKLNDDVAVLIKKAKNPESNITINSDY